MSQRKGTFFGGAFTITLHGMTCTACYTTSGEHCLFYHATEQKTFNRPTECSLNLPTIHSAEEQKAGLHTNFIAFLSRLLATCWLWKIKSKLKKKKKRNIDLAVVRERGPFAVCNTFLYTKFNTNNNPSWRKKKKKDSQSNSPWSFCEDNLWETLSAINNSTATMHTTWIYAPAVTFLITASLC